MKPNLSGDQTRNKERPDRKTRQTGQTDRKDKKRDQTERQTQRSNRLTNRDIDRPEKYTDGQKERSD